MSIKSMTIGNKLLTFPIFFPDATRGVVKSLDQQDLLNAKIEGVVVCSYHLMSTPGLEILNKFGGLASFMNWSGLIVSDSGGFQIMSLIHSGKTKGKITDLGIEFLWEGKGKKEKILFTPELSIQTQFAVQADLMICLDDFTNPELSNESEIEKSVNRTIKWAERAKQEFEKQIKIKKIKFANRPLLLAVVQGGESVKLRKLCAKELIGIGFDAYGFGGSPLNKKGQLDEKILQATCEAMPVNKPKFALGVGKPADIIKGFAMGYNMFDCVLPTRDARHERLYVQTKNLNQVDLYNETNLYQSLYIASDQYTNDQGPISRYCDCFTCQHYSRGYLRHLFKIKEGSAWRLASIHNLRVYTQLIERLRDKK